MAQFLRALVFWPVLAIGVALAIANRQAIQFSFDPFNADAPAFAVTTPLFVILLAGVLIGVLLGGLSAWADQAHWRRLARTYQKQVQQLEAQLAAKPFASAALPEPGQAVVPLRTGSQR